MKAATNLPIFLALALPLFCNPVLAKDNCTPVQVALTDRSITLRGETIDLEVTCFTVSVAKPSLVSVSLIQGDGMIATLSGVKTDAANSYEFPVYLPQNFQVNVAQQIATTSRSFELYIQLKDLQ